MLPQQIHQYKPHRLFNFTQSQACISHDVSGPLRLCCFAWFIHGVQQTQGKPSRIHAHRLLTYTTLGTLKQDTLEKVDLNTLPCRRDFIAWCLMAGSPRLFSAFICSFPIQNTRSLAMRPCALEGEGPLPVIKRPFFP